MADPRHTLGTSAEHAVAAWLEAAGWSVLARRRRSANGGEVDLVALDRSEVLVALEVRARHGTRSGRAAETVDARRCARLARTLAAFAAATPVRHRGLRIDLVTVEHDAGRRWRLTRIPDVGADGAGLSRRRGARGR